MAKGTKMKKELLQQALAYLRWTQFGECRTPGWDGPPPTALELESALVAALAQPILDIEVQRIALDNGFKLKEQPDGTMALNPYVFAFARALLCNAIEQPVLSSPIDFLPYDDNLRFVQRVLESSAPKSDKDDAAQMVSDMRRSIYRAAQPVPPAISTDDFLESQKFYELMQAYRHTPVDAAQEFEAVKHALCATLTQPAVRKDCGEAGCAAGKCGNAGCLPSQLMRVVTDDDLRKCFLFSAGWNHRRGDLARYRKVLETYENNKPKAQS